MKNIYILYIYYAINKKSPGRQTSAGSVKGYSPFFFFSFLRLFETALSRLSIYFFGFLNASFQELEALNTPPTSGHLPHPAAPQAKKLHKRGTISGKPSGRQRNANLMSMSHR